MKKLVISFLILSTGLVVAEPISGQKQIHGFEFVMNTACDLIKSPMARLGIRTTLKNAYHAPVANVFIVQARADGKQETVIKDAAVSAEKLYGYIQQGVEGWETILGRQMKLQKWMYGTEGDEQAGQALYKALFNSKDLVSVLNKASKTTPNYLMYVVIQSNVNRPVCMTNNSFLKQFSARGISSFGSCFLNTFEIDKKNEQKRLKQSLLELETNLKDVKDENTNLKELYEKKSKDFEEKSKDFEKKSEALKKKSEDFNELADSKQAWLVEFTKNSDDLISTRKNLEQVEGDLEQVKKDLDQAKKDRDQFKKDLDQSKKDLDQLQENEKKLKRQKAALKHKIALNHLIFKSTPIKGEEDGSEHDVYRTPIKKFQLDISLIGQTSNEPSELHTSVSDTSHNGTSLLNSSGILDKSGHGNASLNETGSFQGNISGSFIDDSINELHLQLYGYKSDMSASLDESACWGSFCEGISFHNYKPSKITKKELEELLQKDAILARVAKDILANFYLDTTRYETDTNIDEFADAIMTNSEYCKAAKETLNKMEEKLQFIQPTQSELIELMKSSFH